MPLCPLILMNCVIKPLDVLILIYDIIINMRKKRLTFYCIILMFFCQCSTGVMAITEAQSEAIVEHCATIKDDLKKVQKEDARVRVYLGGYYETILSKFITPLNVRLVENNLSSAGLVENQNDFAASRTIFANDFINYQQGLEELVGMDCKEKPEEFYNKLVTVRQKRKTMVQDVLKMRSLISEHVKLVEGLKGKL